MKKFWMDVAMVMKHLLGTENIRNATDTWDRMVSVCVIYSTGRRKERQKRDLVFTFKE